MQHRKQSSCSICETWAIRHIASKGPVGRARAWCAREHAQPDGWPSRWSESRKEMRLANTLSDPCVR